VNQAPVVRIGTLDDLRAVGLLWCKLNNYHQSIGMHFQTDDSSVGSWLDSFTRTLGRFSFLWVAEQEGQVSAFLLGRLKKTPAYLGGVMVGEISDLYVSDDLRGQGIGKQLVSTAMQHFKNQSIHSVEVQIMSQNASGLAFWNSLGFQKDVILVRQMVEPGSGHA
jgi:ribosomal protein S18 acetylase RimI-like enzyme